MATQLPPEMLAACETNHGPMLLALGWSLLCLATITVLLRLYFRHYHRGGIHIDDWTMLASLISGITAVSYLTLLVQSGLGQHIYCLPPSQIPHALHASIHGQIFNILGIGLVKVSLCLTILRIIEHQPLTLLSKRTFLWLLLAIAALSHLAQILLFIIQCRPMRAIWHPEMAKKGEAKCFSSHITYLAGYIGFGLDAFTDLACSAIPIFIIKPLNMRPRTKWPLCVLMGLGCLTAGCAIAKAVTLEGVFDKDYTFGLTKPAVCTILEHLSGMILSSLPALRTMFGNLFGKSESTPNNSSDRKSSTGRSTPPWWARRSSAAWSSPKFPARSSWVPPRSWRLGRKEEKSGESWTGSDDSTVLSSPPERVPLKGAHSCRECGGTGVAKPKSVKKTVSWQIDEGEGERDVEKGATAVGRRSPRNWPLTGSEEAILPDPPGIERRGER